MVLHVLFCGLDDFLPATLAGQALGCCASVSLPSVYSGLILVQGFSQEASS